MYTGTGDKMAYKNFDGFTGNNEAGHKQITLTIDGDKVDLPDASYVRDADIGRDGMDLVLDGPDGKVVVENYFAAEPAPALTAPGGETLTPELVESFARSPAQYADNGGMNDASPVGAVEEVAGQATVTRLDGSVEPVTKGTPIYQGDVVETSGEGAVNIVFADQTSFAVSENARLAIDEYVYDPASQSGTTNFSVLKGMFVFTSGLIGREDPDDVRIDTPVGSIGIRGTIIMADVDAGEVTVVEGAIVLRDMNGNEMTLADQFETGKFSSGNGEIEHMGVRSAGEMTQKFVAVSTVAPALFSSLNDEKSDKANSEPAAEPSEADPLLEQQDAAEEQPQAAEEVMLDQEPVLPPPPLPGVNIFTGQQDGLLDGKPLIDFRPFQPMQMFNEPVGDFSQLGDSIMMPPPPPPGSTLGDAPPPLAVNVQVFAINENTASGAIVGRLVGSFAPSVTFTLTGPNAGLYMLDNITATTADIRFIGVAPDFENTPGHRLPPVGFMAVNDLGTVTLNGVVDTPLLNLFDEVPIINPTFVVPTSYFSASEGTQWRLDMGSTFVDKEVISGDSLSYRVDAGTLSFLNGLVGAGKIASTNINLTTGDIAGGVLEINFANAFTGNNLGGALNVIATDLGGNAVTLNRTFDLHDTTTASTTITGSNQVFGSASTTGQTVLISGTNNKVFAGSGNDTINVSNTGHQVFGGFGNDHFSNDSTASGNLMVGNAGNDLFSIDNVSNGFHGMEGDDTFAINLAAGGTANLAAGAGVIIDGGTDFLSMASATGGDELKFLGTGNIDFTAINNAFVKNIEVINTQNSATNTVTMNLADVLGMTDSRRTLVIDMEAGDNFNYNASTEAITNTGTQTDGLGNTFNVYEIVSGVNTVTLLVDQAANVTGLP